MKKIITYSLPAIAILIALFNTSCDKYIEDDISDARLFMLAPVDGLVTKEKTLMFWWDDIDEASSYHIQVVSHNFDTIVNLLVDSVTPENKLSLTLRGGRYECRVRGENASSKTAYEYRKFTIDTVVHIPDTTTPVDTTENPIDTTENPVSIAGQQITVTTPQNNLFYANDEILFSWNAIENATSYTIALKEETNDGNDVFSPVSITTTETDLSDHLTNALTDGTYIWRVYAVNDISESETSEITINIDKTAPGNPQLTSPANMDTIINSDNVAFNWTQGNDFAGIDYDSVFIYRIDSTATEIKVLEQSLVSNDMQTSATLSDSTWYYWSVVSYDILGHETETQETGNTFFYRTQQ